MSNKKTTVYLHSPFPPQADTESKALQQLRKALIIGLLAQLPARTTPVGRGSELNKSGALSSVGSEHLPYKQGVTGSNPVGPTSNRKPAPFGAGFFIPRRIPSLLGYSEGNKKPNRLEKPVGFLFAVVSSRDI